MPESTSKKSFSTQVIVNSNKYFVQSENWRQDWWLSNNVLYSDVVKNRGKLVNNVQISHVAQGGKCVENHTNVITKCEVNVGKNITVYCGKNITPKQGQNPSKMSIANRNINIAHDNMFRDTKNHYSRVKVSQKPPKTMAH